MLIGRFGNTTGRPYVEGRLVVPRLGLQGDFSLLVDTGADQTYLMPGDAAVLGLNYASLTRRSRTVGVGGETRDFVEPAVAVFEDRGHLYIYGIDLTIAQPNPHLTDVPSLLGRDILDQWAMRYRPAADYLRFSVVTADVIVPLTTIPAHQRIAPAIKHD